MRSTAPANPSPSRAGRRRTQEDVGRVARHAVDLGGEREEDAVAAHLPHDDAHVGELRKVEAEDVVEQLVREIANCGMRFVTEAIGTNDPGRYAATTTSQ